MRKKEIADKKIVDEFAQVFSLQGGVHCTIGIIADNH